MKKSNLTQCGCEVCEDKARKLLTWIESRLGKYSQKTKEGRSCVNSVGIADIPMPVGGLR